MQKILDENRALRNYARSTLTADDYIILSDWL